MSERLAEAMWVGNPWLLPLAFLGGLCTSLNPCAYPMMGAVAGYVWKHGGRSRWRSLGVSGAFLLGLALVYGLLGALGSLLVPVTGLSHRHLMWVVGGVCIAAGALIAEVIPLEFAGSSLLTRYWGRLQGLPGAFVLGVLLGLVATPCATPPLVAIMSLAATRGAVGLGALLMVTYALGHGLPIIVIGLAAGSLSGLQRFAARGRALQIAGGWLIIAVGFYLLATA
jgi:cytochrome c-type biogenesis protein